MRKLLQGRLALIMGASRGLGAAIAKRYAREGAHVILSARTTGGLEEVDDAIKAEGGSATLAPIDLFESDHIDLMAATLHSRFGKLDILVGCAAQIGVLSPAHHIDPRTWERTLYLNLTANQRLIRAYDPLLRLSEHGGRAIFPSCEIAHAPKAFWGAYAASKAGLAALIDSYRQETQKAGLQVHTIDPGPLSTKLRQEAYPGEPPGTQPDPDSPSVTDAFITAAV